MNRQKPPRGGFGTGMPRAYLTNVKKSTKYLRPARRVGARPSNRMDPKGISSVSSEGCGMSDHATKIWMR